MKTAHKINHSANNLLSLSESQLRQSIENTGIVSEQKISSSPALWLCIYLPRIAMDALKCDDAMPLATTEERGGRILVHTCNRKAQSYGIGSGMPLAAALMLCETLKIFAREPLAEQRRLNRLGLLAFDFSHTVSLYTANSVVLEIKGSLRLFDGVKKLLECLTKRLNKFGGETIVSFAPTARAALWMTQCGNSRFIAETKDLIPVLRDLPVSVLTTDKRRLIRLNRSGIATVEDVLRLPRDGVIRRFGTRLMDNLDLALAKQPEPLNLFHPPEVFSASVEFCQPTSKLGHLVSAASTLLQQFETFLVERQAATQHIQCMLKHHKHPVTVIDIGSNFEIQRADQFLFLLEEHLNQRRLATEVKEVTIYSNQMDVFFPEQLDLFDTSSADKNAWQRLVEHFRVRLGEKVLQPLSLHPDHRPENAGTTSALSCSMGKASEIRRPVWILSHPEPLKASLHQLYWHGPLCLSYEVECIEQGWWDGNDVCRDYRIAQNSNGSCLWLFQDRRSKQWFLHGLFG